MLAIRALSLATLALCAYVDILGPDSDSYWIQFTENNITWAWEKGDVENMSIFISHPDSSVLNGNFTIAEYTAADQHQFTVTNVTLRVAKGYIINFYEAKNPSNVLATSVPFEVKPEGTKPDNPLLFDTKSSQSSSTASASATKTTNNANPIGTAPPDDSSSRLAISAVALVGAAVASLLL
ncbi:hypothetical protein BKA62DRAFT_141124 [Auriculariales sp. MPI-PUGE-AT-0066]|nr:hypothetical protein BKA62DRAFT_141124 [Auriculariales sp. MPI-PUGE-AT-0066]